MAPPVAPPDRVAPEKSGSASVASGVPSGDRATAIGEPSPAASADAPRAGRTVLIGLAVVAAAVSIVLLAPPDLSELADIPRLVANGHPGWLAAALLFEVLSFAGYVALFRAVFVDDGSRVGWSESYAITMAGLAATRLFASAGAGGVALTAWALRRLEVPARRIADRMVAFLVLLYGVYMGCLVVFGLGLWAGLFAGPAPWALTLVPAALGALVIAAGLALTRVPAHLGRSQRGDATRATRVRRVLGRIGLVPAAAGRGARVAVSLLRRREPGLVGALAWWGFDIAVLWASFHAFGEPPPVAALVVAYFVGMLGNLLPLPGGVGGVEGGMIGALIAFGVAGGLAVIAVLAYRVFAFWLPTLPGALAYLQLRRAFSGRPRNQVAEERSRDSSPIRGRRWATLGRRAAAAALATRRRLTRWRFAWLAAAAVVCGTYLAGAFPDLPGIEEAVTVLGDELGPWTYAVVGGLALLETAALVGVLAPGEWSVIVGGAVAGGGSVGLVPMIAAVWACAAAGSGLSFLAGRRFGRAFLVRHGRRFRVGPERLARVDRFFVRHGAKAVIGGQFIGLVRAVVPFLAGSSGMAYRRFALPSVTATGAWATAYTLLGYFFYRSLADVEVAIGLAAAVGTGLAAVVAITVWLRHRRGAPHRLAHGRATVRSLALNDGSTVEVRPLEVGDRAELAAAFGRLSPESRRRRFGTPKPRLSDRELTFLTDVDHHRHEALVALEPVTGRGVAVARYVVFPQDPATADVAVTVDDGWQGRGLGKALSLLLLERAAVEGVDRLRATVGGDNLRALTLARRIGYEASSVGSGNVELERRVSSCSGWDGLEPTGSRGRSSR